MHPDLNLLVEFFKNLADPTRLQILGLLAVRERSVAELAEAVAIKAPTASHHLARLKQLGLVAVRAEGTTRHYSLDADALRALAQRTLEGETLTSIGAEADLDAEDRRIVRGYLKDGRLSTIPSQRKKRAAVLRALAGRFEPDRVYDERQIDAILREWHDDVATLRRELVMARWLLRDRRGSEYRLNPETPRGPLPSGRW
ncbi:MAG: metalloregulator ArsR/SmtB family transcription factor [Myxococcales bacterium]|nr:metalloregulator ArsR/SmtB family transcription factor [Myxococcales bacterium]MCB9525405.1 metalloregulator ArsR/SmtB family transcription factor [Myxococcales bacterium]